MNRTRLAAAIFCLLIASSARADDAPLPGVKPVPEVQVVPQPYAQASFQAGGRELARYHFGPLQERPFWYPIVAPSGHPLTRMGHPHDPITHSHHNSVWVSHDNVGGVRFWADRNTGRIVHERIEAYEDGPQAASMLSVNSWRAPDGKTLMLDRRRTTVEPLGSDGWRMLIDLELQSPGNEPVTLGQTPFGLIAVRMAKTIGVADGGGRILNSQGQHDEKEAFRKPARWVDYSGPVTNQLRGGIALLDHPGNPGHPTPFHVRNDGWMGVSLNLNGPITIEPGKPLRLRYALWVHDGVPKPEAIESAWQTFSRTDPPRLAAPRKK